MLHRFVTAEDSQGTRNPAKAGGAEGEDDDETVYGDFEDLETGQVFTAGAKVCSHTLIHI